MNSNGEPFRLGIIGILRTPNRKLYRVVLGKSAPSRSWLGNYLALLRRARQQAVEIDFTTG
jgi:hypothetical protein